MRALVLIATVLVLILGGCGQGGSETGSGAATSSPSSRAEAGGEASIEGFGSEAEGSEREQILAVFAAYLNAIAGRDYRAACSQLAVNARSSLAQIAGKAGSKAGCAEILQKLLSPSAPAISAQQAEGAIARVRFEGDRGFVVFRAPGADLYEMPMSKEGGDWRVGLVAASVLVPSPPTLGEGG